MNSLRTVLIFVFDIMAYFLSLFILLFLRYGEVSSEFLYSHMALFSVILPLWFVISYLFDLWHVKIFKNQTIIFKRLFFSTLLFLVSSAVIIYLFTDYFIVTPKTNLLIFCVIFFFIDYFFKFFLRSVFYKHFKTKVFILGSSDVIDEISLALNSNPQMGYETRQVLENINFEDLNELVSKEKNDVFLVFPDTLMRDKNLDIAYKSLFIKNAELISLSDFYELIFIKESIESIDESWFVSNIKPKKIYDSIKRISDIILSLILMVMISPIFLLILISILLFDRGPIFFSQERMGRDGKSFVLHKFRSMKVNNGPAWEEKNDSRITPIGKFIRKTHIDEIPQLYNILRGDISFVGPRPEQTRVIDLLKDEIPYYDTRHIVLPGLTGWAQIHYMASNSVDETREKLKYDLYYIKNASLLLDVLILIKTVKLLFLNPK